MKRLLICLLMVGVVGCGKSEQAQEGPENPAKAENDTDWIVEALAVRLGENKVDHKELVNTFGPLTPRKERFLCRWLEKGKAIEMVSEMKQETEQGNQTQRMYVVCRYDPKKNLFVQTVTVEGKSQPWIDLTWDRKTSRFEAEHSLPEPVGAKGEISFKWTDNKTLEGDYKIIQGDKVLLHRVSTGQKTKTTANDQEFDQLKASILGEEPVSLARSIFDKRVHFELADGTGPFWAQFNADGTHEHSHREKGTYTVDGLAVSVKDFEHVTLLFSKPTISAGDTFEATVVNDEKGLVFKVLRVEQAKVDEPPVQAVGADPSVDSDLRYVVEDGTVRIIENSSRLGGLSAGTRLPERIDGKPVTSIGSKAYAGSDGRVFIIPDSVTDIGEQAFANCYGLEEVTIGKNVTSIGNGAFRFSMPLKSITIPGSVVTIGKEAFFSCRTLADITLNEGVSSIGKLAFANTYVEDITFPKSIKSVGKDAFYSCTRLTTVTFLGDAPEEVGRVFSGRAIIYRKDDAKGWGDTWGGRPVKLVSEKP